MMFREGAARLAALAALSLGWRPDEFWSATPSELAGIWRVLAQEGGIGAATGMDRAALRQLQEEMGDG